MADTNDLAAELKRLREQLAAHEATTKKRIDELERKLRELDTRTRQRSVG